MRLNNHTKITKFYKKLIYGEMTQGIMALFCFLMGRVILFGTINPVIMAYLSLFLGKNSFFLAITAAILGLASIGDKIFVSRYIYSIIVMLFLDFYVINKDYKLKKVMGALIGGISLCIGGCIFSLLNYGSVYFLTLSLLEGVLTVLVSYIFSYGMNIALRKNYNTIIKNEEALSLVALLCCFVVGAGNIYFGSASLSLYFIFIFLFLLAYNGGTVVTLGGGAIVSALLVFTKAYTSDIFLVLFTGCFMASLSAKLHKLCTPVGFLIGAVPIAFFFYRNFLSVSTFVALTVAAVTIGFLPDKLYWQFPSFINTGKNSEEFGEMVKEVAATRLTGFSYAFNKLARALNKKVNDPMCTKEMSALVDDITLRVCESCTMKSFCWERNFYKTYQMVIDILTACSTKGYMDKESIPKSFCESCYKINEFYWAISNICELHKQKIIWNNKITQSRLLMGSQLSGVSRLLDKLEKELSYNFVFDNEKSKLLTMELSDLGVSSAVVYDTAQNNKEVLIDMANCHGCNACTRELIPRLNGLLGKKMRRYSYQCYIKDENCRLRLVEEKRFSISTYVAATSKGGGVSGDSHTFMELEGGVYLMALSDGMGSGVKAREESAAGIELFEDFMCAGFDKEMAINLINSTLLLRAEEDMFTTLDICTVNLYTGMAEFVKIGAVSSYIIHKKRVEAIRSSTLPVGILGTVDTETAQTQLSRDDLIVMTTDGVPDSYNNTLKGDSWLKTVIEGCPYNKPEAVAEYILSKAKENNNEEKDDMTVLVAKIW